jgi:UPF0176 protein
MSITVSTFYKFVPIADPLAFKTEVAAFGCQQGLKGTILVAREGINATVSGTHEAITALLHWLRSDARFSDLVSNESFAAQHPFRRYKVKVKPEIVTFGHPDVDPVTNAGTYVPPEHWNALIQDPGVIVIDTRNSYEFDVGTFRGAIDPKTKTFREFSNFVGENLDPAKHHKVAMFCTGGIRCEKATAYMRAQGFRDVYHLEGGILKYLEVIPKQDSLWQGECFIFDERVALEHGVTPGGYVLCTGCGYPIHRTGSADDSVNDCPKCALRAPSEGAASIQSGN